MSTRQTVLAEITKEKHNNAHHVIASLLKQYQEPLSEGPLPRLQNEYMVICKASQLDQLKPFAPLVEVHTVGDLEPHTSVAQKVHSLLREVTGRPETPQEIVVHSWDKSVFELQPIFCQSARTEGAVPRLESSIALHAARIRSRDSRRSRE